jgi:hypothetical protein
MPPYLVFTFASQPYNVRACVNNARPTVKTRLDHDIVQELTPHGHSKRKSVFGLFTDDHQIPADIEASLQTLVCSLQVLANHFSEYWFNPVRVLERRFNVLNAHVGCSTVFSLYLSDGACVCVCLFVGVRVCGCECGVLLIIIPFAALVLPL